MQILKSVSNALSVSSDWINVQNNFSLKATLTFSNVITNQSQISDFVRQFEAEKQQIINLAPSGYTASINATNVIIECKFKL